MTDRLDVRLAAGNPLPDPPPLSDAVVAAAVAELVRERPVRRRRRRARGRAVLVAAIAAVVVLPSAGVAMEAAGIHTGFFPGRGDTESTPGEEYLDSGDPGIVSVVRGLTAEFPLPPGESWAPLLARWPSKDGAIVQRTGLGQEVEWYARCRWEAAWLRAHDDGDAAAAAEIAGVLLKAAEWPNTASGDAGGVVAALRETAAAAAAGDPARVRREYRANCA
jgi:hypothetical protein